MVAKQKTIKVASASKRRIVNVPVWWVGRWVAINSQHMQSLFDGEYEIIRHVYVITHRKTGYAIGSSWYDTPLRTVRKMAEKLDKLGADCWDFTRPNTPLTKRWSKLYRPQVSGIIGQEKMK